MSFLSPSTNATRFLNALFDHYNDRKWVTSDPIQFPHRYEHADDREVVAFIACCFAYGSAKLVVRAVDEILKPLGSRPATAVKSYGGKNLWPGFVYRFHRAEHISILMRLLAKALREYGSLSELFRRNQNAAIDGHCAQALSGAARWFHLEIEQHVSRTSTLYRGMRFLFNSPENNSACKRMTMFLRWVVRSDAIDLGLSKNGYWNWLSPSDLVIPVDTHVGRIGYYLHLRKGKENQAATWRMALEITDSLKKFNASDPVAYDFALSRLGILDICKKRYTVSICKNCHVEPVCRYSNLQKLPNSREN